MKEFKLNLVQFILIIFGVIVITSLVVVEIMKYHGDLVEPREINTNTTGKVEEELIENVISQKEIPESIIIGNLDYYKKDGFGNSRKWINPLEGDYLKYEDADKYEGKEYYVYTKNSDGELVKIRTTEGAYEGELSLEYDIFENEKLPILIDLEYDAIPRKSEVTKLSSKMKENIINFEEYDENQAEKIDLDGDGKEEYIIFLESNKNNKASILLIMDENTDEIGIIANVSENCLGIFDLSNVTYIDLDNDNQMEIVIDVPMYEGSDYAVFKYENGKLIGDAIDVTIDP